MFKQFKSSDPDNVLNGLNVLIDLNDLYARTAGRTSCPSKSICWYQSA